MQTSRRSILKGSILASLAGTMGATAMSASAAEKQAALPKKEYDLVICGLVSVVSSPPSAQLRTA